MGYTRKTYERLYHEIRTNEGVDVATCDWWLYLAANDSYCHQNTPLAGWLSLDRWIEFQLLKFDKRLGPYPLPF